MKKFKAVNESVRRQFASRKQAIEEKAPQQKTISVKSQEAIIRELQKVFCKGRYRSWVLTKV